jgi:hypothetical protein
MAARPLQFIPPETKTFPLDARLLGCRALADQVLTAFGGPQPGDLLGERMVLAVWARAAGTFDAALRLASEDSYGDQVLIMARALFEAAVDAYWIAKHPAEAQRLAVLHFRQSRLLIAETWNEHALQPGDPALPLFTEDISDRELLAGLFGPHGDRHWSRQSLYRRVKEVDATVTQDSKGELLARYNLDNRLANLAVHGGAVTINDRVTDGRYDATIIVGATPQHLANGLRHAYWSYERLCLLVSKRRAPATQATIEALYADTWPQLQTVTVPALKHAGRNGTCPCGSGHKVKACHGAI